MDIVNAQFKEHYLNKLDRAIEKYKTTEKYIVKDDIDQVIVDCIEILKNGIPTINENLLKEEEFQLPKLPTTNLINAIELIFSEMQKIPTQNVNYTRDGIMLSAAEISLFIDILTVLEFIMLEIDVEL